MNSNEFIQKLKEVASMNTIYMWGCFGQKVEEGIIATKSKQYPSWYTTARQNKFRKLIGKNYYAFDCVCLIKGILWGFPNIKYASNGVDDIGADTMINRCNNISTDFNNITPGEAVWLSGHIGVYIGNGQVIECTPAWKDGVQVTSLNQRKWVKHGKLPYIDYVSETRPAEPIVNDNVYVVIKGDTLTKIAKQFGTTIQAIATANNIADVNKIYIGQKLVIPVGTQNNQPQTKTKTITANSGLVLRSEPRKSSTYITAYPKGTQVAVARENVASADGFNWDEVNVNGKNGYMANAYLR